MEDALPRKRVKRDTRTCSECRRRKVKCELSTKDVPACTECVKRGVQCTIYQHISESTPGNPSSRTLSPSNDERLERIENLLVNLAGRQFTSRPLAESYSIELANTTTHSRVVGSFDRPDSSPVLTLLRDGILACSRAAEEHTISQGASAKAGELKQILIELFPSHHDIKVITESTMAWILDLNNPPGAIMPKLKQRPVCFAFADLAEVSISIVGRTLLYLTLYMQQLPPDFDYGKLDMRGTETKVRSFVNAVSSFVLADEEIVCSREGVQCLLLLGMIYVNDGALEKAWATFRRALDLSRLMGLHSSYSSSMRDNQIEEMIMNRQMWLSAMMGDCYTSLLLGLECGGGTQPLGPDDGWTDKSVDVNTTFCRKFCPIVNSLVQRNLFKIDEDYLATQAIEARLDKLQRSISPSWWAIPKLTTEKSLKSAIDFDRLFCHMWFFQVRAFTHLPLIFRTVSEETLAYSRATSLDASRAILHRYLSMRQVDRTQLHCRVIDFAAFVASVTVLLLLMQNSTDLSASPSGQQTSPDLSLVHDIIHTMEILAARGQKEVVAKQGIEALKTLLEYHKTGLGESNALQLTIPYFGTIKIASKSSKPGDNVYRTPPGAFDNLPVLSNPATGQHERASQEKVPSHVCNHIEIGRGASPPVMLTFSNVEFPSVNAEALKTPDIDALLLDGVWDTDD